MRKGKSYNKKHNQIVKDYDNQKSKHLDKLADKMLKNDEKTSETNSRNKKSGKIVGGSGGLSWPARSRIRHRAKRKLWRVAGNSLRNATKRLTKILDETNS